jgi:serine/threonine-protein kinase RsbW
VFLKSPKKGDKKRSVKIASDIRNMRKVSLMIVDTLSHHHVAEDKVFDIRLCTEEAVRNAIVHGNNSNKRLSVEVRWRVEDGALLIEIEDEGKGFNHSTLADPTASENVERNCGRGVYLIKKLMDRVEYNSKGNCIRMAKRLT